MNKHLNANNTATLVLNANPLHTLDGSHTLDGMIGSPTVMVGCTCICTLRTRSLVHLFMSALTSAVRAASNRSSKYSNEDDSKVYTEIWPWMTVHLSLMVRVSFASEDDAPYISELELSLIWGGTVLDLKSVLKYRGSHQEDARLYLI